MSDRVKTQIIDLTHAQIQALYWKIASPRGARLRQTYTKSGGTHLYVEADGETYHVAAGTGNVAGPLAT